MIEYLVKQMTCEGSILKETECIAVIMSFLKRIGLNITEGIGFQSEYFSVSIGISGNFADEKDRFDSERHQIYPNLCIGKIWKKNLTSARPF